jgi:hypothetical protein
VVKKEKKKKKKRKVLHLLVVRVGDGKEVSERCWTPARSIVTNWYTTEPI